MFSKIKKWFIEYSIGSYLFVFGIPIIALIGSYINIKELLGEFTAIIFSCVIGFFVFLYTSNKKGI